MSVLGFRNFLFLNILILAFLVHSNMELIRTVAQAFGIGHIEKPPYEILEQLASNMEIRKYPPTKWVCSSVKTEAKKMQSHSNTMFGTLFRYISGKNDASQKIAMTTPVTFDMQASNDAQLIDDKTQVDVTMRFYVPKEYHDKTPVPSNGAYLTEDPEMSTAVVTFGGYASMSDYYKYRDLLIEKLGERAKEYDCVNMMLAGYDAPFKPYGRTNEVWLKKFINTKLEKICVESELA